MGGGHGLDAGYVRAAESSFVIAFLDHPHPNLPLKGGGEEMER